MPCIGKHDMAHAAPPDVSLAAVSSIEGFRTPALGVRGAVIMGRHPKTFTLTDIVRSVAHV